MIILNGAITVDGTEIYFDDLIVESGEELDMPFDFLIDDEDDYCDDDCDDCEFCDDVDEEYGDVEIIDELTSFYAEILRGGCACPECIKKILVDYTMDLLSDLAE